MKKTFSIISVAVLVMMLLLAGASCVPSGQTPSPTGEGIVEVYITDAPPQEQVTSVLVTVSKVEIHKAGSGDQVQEQEREQQREQEKQQTMVREQEKEQKQANGRQNAPGQQQSRNTPVMTQQQKQVSEQQQEQEQEQNDGSWTSIDITAQSNTFDLLKIKGVEELFGTSQVEAGRYTQVRLTIDKVEVGLGGKTAEEVKLPSGVLKIVHPFEIKAGETTELLLDFDAEKSVNVTGDSKVIVKPTVKLSVKQKSTGKPAKQITEEESQKIARNFVKTDETFAFDGIADTLKLTKTEAVNNPGGWAFTYEFDSKQAGYGDRTGQILAQVITHHVAVIVVQQGKVTSAIMDERWDMLTEKETLEWQIKDATKVNVDASSNGKEVEMAVGNVLVVTLDSNITTGFSWTLKGITDKTVLEHIGNKYIAPGQGSLAGQGGQEVWYFKALAVGKSALTMEYRRPWEQNVNAEKTFTVTANVK